ncbi:MAG: D-alanyl-D-alanine dipeptidase [Bacillota bacterium]|nr:D-alanyl-D-alanine dipeptidase [Bacillota bacterium]
MRKNFSSLIIPLIFVSILLYGCSSGKDRLSLPVSSSEVQQPASTAEPQILKGDYVSPTVPANESIPSTPEVQVLPPAPPKKMKNLVNIQDINSDIVVDLKYATADNFTGKVIYDFTICLLREETAAKLSKASQELMKLGYRIKIFDGYRPPYAQKILWSKVPDERYVANPSKGGSIHSKGAAVDVTIVDSQGKELEMPSKYDDLTAHAGRSNNNISENAKKNLKLLTNVMTSNGFKILNSEWWHYDDTDSTKYPQVDVIPSDFQ